MGGFVRRLAGMPALQFLAIGAGLFLAVRALDSDRDPASYRIVIGPGQVESVVATFMKASKRPPSPQELRSLLEEQVRQEIYVREAVVMGLDRDDFVVRRRLRQKMEFVAAEGATAGDAERARREHYEKLRRRYTVIVEPAVKR